MNKEQALQLWKELFGDQPLAYDYASHPLRRDDFQDDSHGLGWDVDLKQPLYLGGSYAPNNLVITSLQVKSLREGKPAFKIGKLFFEVRKGKTYGSFCIYDVTDKANPVPMDPNAENQEPLLNENRVLYSVGRPHPVVSNTQSVSPFTTVTAPVTGTDYLNFDLNAPVTPSATTVLTADTKPAEVAPVAAETVPVEPVKAEPTVEATPVVPSQPAADVEPVAETKLAEPAAPAPEKQEETPVAAPLTPETPAEETKPADVSPMEETKPAEAAPAEETKPAETATPAPETPIPEAAAPIDVKPDDVQQEAVPVPAEPKEEAPAVTEASPVVEPASETAVEPAVPVNEEPKEDNGLLVLAINDPLTSALRPQEEEQPSVTEAKEENPLPATWANDNTANDIVTEPVSLTNDWKLPDYVEEAKPVAVTPEPEVAPVNEKPLDEPQPEITPVVAEKPAEEAKPAEEVKPAEPLPEETPAVKEPQPEALPATQEAKPIEEPAPVMDTKPAETSAVNEETKPAESVSPIVEETVSEVSDEKKEEQPQPNAELEQLKKDQADQALALAQAELEKTKLQSALDQEKLSSATLSEQVKALSEQNVALKNQAASLTLEEASIQDKSNQLEAIVASLSKEKNDLQKLNTTLTDENGKLKISFDSLRFKENALQNEQGKNQLTEAANAQLKEQKAALVTDNQALQAKIDDLTHQLTQAQQDNTALNQMVADDKVFLLKLTDDEASRQDVLTKAQDDLAALSDAKQASDQASASKIAELEATLTDQQQKLDFVSRGGKLDSYPALIEALKAASLPYTEENLKKALEEHPDWIYKPEPDVADAISTNANKAMALFQQKYGPESYQVSDFAGREIRIDDYGKSESPYGWNTLKIDDAKGDELDNLLFANLKSLADLDKTKPFVSNGHAFAFLADRDGKKNLVSQDFIADPYDCSAALDVISKTQDKQEPLVYLFIKFTGALTSIPDPQAMNDFICFIEKTFKRFSPKSALDMQTNRDNVFLTFDGTMESAPKDAYRYAILLNSYRNEFKKQSKLNAILVLDQVQVKTTSRHVDLEKLTSETKDPDLRAIKAEINSMAVIDSMINRTIHIGPEIFPSLGLKPEALKTSYLGQGNFAITYGFKGQYYECRYVNDIHGSKL